MVRRVSYKIHLSDLMTMQEAMVPWLCHFHSVKSILLFSTGAQIPVLDKFTFRSGLVSIQPDLIVKVL